MMNDWNLRLTTTGTFLSPLTSLNISHIPGPSSPSTVISDDDDDVKWRIEYDGVIKKYRMVYNSIQHLTTTGNINTMCSNN